MRSADRRFKPLFNPIRDLSARGGKGRVIEKTGLSPGFRDIVGGLRGVPGSIRSLDRVETWASTHPFQGASGNRRSECGNQGLGRPPSRMDGRGVGGKMQALEDASNDRGICDHGNQASATVAVRTFQDVDLEYPSHQFRHCISVKPFRFLLHIRISVTTATSLLSIRGIRFTPVISVSMPALPH